jgi:integrase
MDSQVLRNGLKDACAACGVNTRARNIVFHSWRHYYASRMTDILSPDTVAKATGHKDLSVLESYAAHGTEKNLEEMADAGAEIFGRILPFAAAEKGA